MNHDALINKVYAKVRAAKMRAVVFKLFRCRDDGREPSLYEAVSQQYELAFGRHARPVQNGYVRRALRPAPFPVGRYERVDESFDRVELSEPVTSGERAQGFDLVE